MYSLIHQHNQSMVRVCKRTPEESQKRVRLLERRRRMKGIRPSAAALTPTAPTAAASYVQEFRKFVTNYKHIEGEDSHDQVVVIKVLPTPSPLPSRTRVRVEQVQRMDCLSNYDPVDNVRFLRTKMVDPYHYHYLPEKIPNTPLMSGIELRESTEYVYRMATHFNLKFHSRHDPNVTPIMHMLNAKRSLLHASEYYQLLHRSHMERILKFNTLNLIAKQQRLALSIPVIRHHPVPLVSVIEKIKTHRPYEFPALAQVRPMYNHYLSCERRVRLYYEKQKGIYDILLRLYVSHKMEMFKQQRHAVDGLHGLSHSSPDCLNLSTDKFNQI